MGFRFRKSIKIAPGVKLNLGKKSTGISVGNKFGGVSINTKTGVTTRVSAPGTGMSYTSRIGGKHKRKNASSSVAERAHIQKPYKPFYKRAWYIVLTIVLLLGGFGCIPSNIGAAVCGLLIAAALIAGAICSALKH